MVRSGVALPKELCDVIDASFIGNKAHICQSSPPSYYVWKSFLKASFHQDRVPNIKKGVLQTHVTRCGIEVEVRLKEDSRHDGYLWGKYLKRGITLACIKSAIVPLQTYLTQPTKT